MHSLSRLALLSVFCLTTSLRAAESDSASLAQFEKTVQEIIEKTEPGIACVLVSRSDAYQRYEATPTTDQPGVLGVFNLTKAVNGSERLLKLLRALDLSDPDTIPESFGSGIVINDNPALILTCAHVVQGATKVYVRLPGGKGSYADIHALDPRSDLAVLKLIDRVPGLKPLKIQDAEKIKKGQFAITLANPYAAGFRDGSPSASWGIVSNVRRKLPGATSELERNLLNLNQFSLLIELDTRLNAGCSGGAVLNLKGEVVGMTTAQAALTGIDRPGGFAIPFDPALRKLIAVLERGEEVEYGFLGVQFDPTYRDGVRVKYVIPGSPAKAAGLQEFDVLVSINGIPIKQMDDVFLYIGTHLCGSTVEIERLRNGKGSPQKVLVKLSKYYVPRSVVASKRPAAVAGIRVDHASVFYQRSKGERWGIYDGVPDGVVIREVVAGSAADRAKLQPDKMITKVNTTRVSNPAEFYTAMGKVGRKVQLTLLTSEGGEEKITLELE